MRLAVRDNKKKYLKLIPYAWEMIDHRIKEQSEFKNLILLLKNNFPKFIKQSYENKHSINFMCRFW